MYLGIDFGAQRTRIGAMYLDQPVLLTDTDGVASAFYYDELCGAVAGDGALELGRGFSEVNLVRGVKLEPEESFLLDGKPFSGEEIIGRIYAEALTRGRAYAAGRGMPGSVDGVVLTAPARFSLQEQELLARCARSCLPDETVPVTGVIPEPVAAALSRYPSGLPQDTCLLVYDLGGSCCEISLLRADSSRPERFVLVDTHALRLGGGDWDGALEAHLTAIAQRKTNLQIVGNPGYEEMIRREAIRVKHRLSEPDCTQTCAKLALGDGLEIEISRNIFDELTLRQLEQTLDAAEELYELNRGSCRIRELICAGGGANMPQITDGLRRRMPDLQIHNHCPELAVVRGAAICAQLFGPGGSVLAAAVEVTRCAYGIACREGEQLRPVVLLPANTRLPAVGAGTFAPAQEITGQVQLEICRILGNSATPIGKLTLDPGGEAGVIECVLSMEEQGALTASAAVGAVQVKDSFSPV